MARVTVEDCVLEVPNRFELVMIASQRAREIAGGAPLTIERDNDKNPVIALREIADKTVSLETLRDAMVKGHQRIMHHDDTEDEIIELMDGEQGWVRPMTDTLEGDGMEELGEVALGDEDDEEFDEEETAEMDEGEFEGIDEPK